MPRTFLELAGIVSLVAGFGLWLGLAAALLAFGVAALVVSWRLGA